MTDVFQRSWLDKAADLYPGIVVMACLLTLTMNCNLFKNTASNLNNTHELSSADTKLKLTEQRDWLSRSAKITLHHDSSNLDYMLQIWPKGMFSFTPQQGFTGEAERILLTGKSRSGSASSEISTALQQDKGKTSGQLSTSKKHVAGAKLKTKSTAPSWKWIVALLAIMGFAGCYIYTKIKLFFKT
jgi:hypothetical protein